MWRNLALLISIVLTLLIIAIILHIKNLKLSTEVYSELPLRRCLMSKEYNNLKAGDIIYTRNSLASFQDLIVPYTFTHIGIVIEFNNKLYMAETAGSGIIGRRGTLLIQRNGGVDIFPLDERVKNAVGIVFISQLNKPLTYEKKIALQDTILDHFGQRYPQIYKLYMLFILKIQLKRLNKYCHTLVYECLKNMKLVEQEKLTAHELGDFITTIFNYQLREGYYYNPPRQLVYDFDCNDEIF